MNLAGIYFDDKELVGRVMRNITRPQKGSFTSYRWVVVMATFGCGS
jgi:hypothetical protein